MIAFKPEQSFAETPTVHALLDAALWSVEAALRASNLPRDDQGTQDAIQSAQAALERADATLSDVTP